MDQVLVPKMRISFVITVRFYIKKSSICSTVLHFINKLPICRGG